MLQPLLVLPPVTSTLARTRKAGAWVRIEVSFAAKPQDTMVGQTTHSQQ